MKYNNNFLTQSFINEGVLKGRKADQQQSKTFLNLTIQKLIQQQKRGQNNVSLIPMEVGLQDKKQNLDEMALLLQLAKEKNENIYSTNQSYQKLNKTVDGSHKQPRASNKSLGRLDKSKFSSTMKLSDFNQTCVFDAKLNTQSKKQSKSSLKNTQNINFKEESNAGNMIPKNQGRKQSALSTYSMNTALATTTHNQKNRGVINAKQGVQIKAQKQKSKQHIRQHSKDATDKSILNQILNFYQNENMQTANIKEELKGQHIQAMKMQCKSNDFNKHKGNATLAQYLQIKTQQINNKAEEQQFFQKSPRAKIEGTDSLNKQNEINRIINMKQKEHRVDKKNSQKQNPDCNIYSSNKTHKEIIKEIQNKTQPLPRTLIEIAQAEAGNLSTGTSIIGKRASQSSNKLSKSRSKNGRQKVKEEFTQKEYLETRDERQRPKIGKKKDVEINKTTSKNIFHKTEDPNECYNNKQPLILDKDDDEENCENKSNNQMGSKLDRFIMGKQIGQGAYAIVRMAVSKADNKKYAIKIYDKSKLTDANRQKSVRREIKLLQKMNHPHIVKIFEAFETDHNVYLVMEFVSGGSLHSYLKERPNRRLEEEEAKRIFKQIITALQYCHRKSIAHRDIKLENILLDENKNVKIIDFGFSTCIPNDKKIKMFCGTPSYMAPEIISKIEYAGPQADIWASAVLLYALLNGCFPFRGATDKELYKKIYKAHYIIHNSLVSEEFISLLGKMINVDPDLRPSADEILKDPWFIKNNYTKEQQEQQQKKLFKAKIQGKVQVEKNSNTLHLPSNNEKLLQQNRQGIQQNCQAQTSILNLDFSDYGLQSQNVMRKLNQEAYQAYYNTTGSVGTSSMQTQQIQQNPYFNNFFQGTTTTNQGNSQAQGLFGNISAMNNNNFQMRVSPQRYGSNLQTHAQYPLIFANNHQSTSNGTPQVLYSPTGNNYNPNGGSNLIIYKNPAQVNNNFNIINNITQVTCPTTQEYINIKKTFASSPNDSDNQQEYKQGKSDKEKSDTSGRGIDFDEEIVNSITKLGYQRSHVVSQLEVESSHLSQLYSRLKEEKLSLTQGRALSQQPHSRKTHATQVHNNGIFPNFVPSIYDSVKGGEQNKTMNNQLPSQGDSSSQQNQLSPSQRLIHTSIIST